MVEAHATAKYVRTSAQKAGLVMDLIRGRDVNSALSALRNARKGVAHDIEKVLRSAIANAQQKEGFGGDVGRLFVAECYANQGPSMKRVRPAPMGRAFRIMKRTAHLTVKVAERPMRIAAAPEPEAKKPARKGAPKQAAPAKAAASRGGRTTKKAAARPRAAKKAGK